jgi:hypothetical protein
MAQVVFKRGNRFTKCCLPTNTKVVAHCAANATNKRAGDRVCAKRICHNSAAKRSNAATFKIVVQTSRKGGRAKRHKNKGLFPHVTLPLFMVFIVRKLTLFCAK